MQSESDVCELGQLDAWHSFLARISQRANVFAFSATGEQIPAKFSFVDKRNANAKEWERAYGQNTSWLASGAAPFCGRTSANKLWRKTARVFPWQNTCSTYFQFGPAPSVVFGSPVDLEQVQVAYCLCPWISTFLSVRVAWSISLPQTTHWAVSILTKWCSNWHLCHPARSHLPNYTRKSNSMSQFCFLQKVFNLLDAVFNCYRDIHCSFFVREVHCFGSTKLGKAQVP